MKLSILIKNVYGNTLYYPHNEPAKALAVIAGSKTLTPAELAIAHDELGFEIEFVDSVSLAKPFALAA
jgi:hypothetical protein